MNLSVRNLLGAVVLLVLCACGGSGFTPFDDVSKEQAMGLLSASGRSKVPPGSVDHLFNQSSNDVLVEFVMAHKPGDPPDLAMAEFITQRNKVTQTFSASELTILQSFDAVQSIFARVHSRAALVKLLNNDDVRAVFENVPQTLAEPHRSTPPATTVI